MLHVPKENKVVATQIGKKNLLPIFKGRTKIEAQAAAKWRHQNNKKLFKKHYEDLTRFMHGKQKKSQYIYCKILPCMWEKDKVSFTHKLQRCQVPLFSNYALLTLTHKFSPSQIFTKGSLNITAVWQWTLTVCKNTSLAQFCTYLSLSVL